MSQRKRKSKQMQISVVKEREEREVTGFAGALALQRVWEQLGVSSLLEEAGIRYGCGEDKASSMSFALTLGPLVQASSVRRVAQRFGREPSPDGVEKDIFLQQLLAHSFDQRSLNRFVNKERHAWRQFHQARVRQLQQMDETKAAAGGVVIVDDFPVPKPYAEEMDYLAMIRDANQDRDVLGYLLVHLYYYHPQRFSYSLYVEPWRKTSATGETAPKPRRARRPAHAGEERSRLDIAVDALRDFLPLLPTYEAVIFDSWYTARWVGHALSSIDVPWIGQAEGTQKFEVDGDYLWTKEIVARFWEQRSPVPGCNGNVQALAFPAVIRPDQYTRVAQAVQLVLVTGLHASEDNDETEDEPDYRLLICNRPDWSSEQIVSLFSYRPQIEQLHRQGKQRAGWGSFQNRRWPALQAHWAFALLRSLLLALLQFWTPGLHAFSLREIIAHGIHSVAWLPRWLTHRFTFYLSRGQPVARLCLRFFLNRDISFVKVL